MCVVNKYGLMALKTGRFNVPKTVNKIIMLMVVTIGPIEFSANDERKNPTEATVIKATKAKPKASNSARIHHPVLLKQCIRFSLKKDRLCQISVCLQTTQERQPKLIIIKYKYRLQKILQVQPKRGYMALIKLNATCPH